jgi:hypothetical protein
VNLKNNFTTQFTLLCLALAVTIFILNNTSNLFGMNIVYAFIFFASLTYAMHLIGKRALAMNPKNSMSIFMGINAFRLIASFIYIVSYVGYTGTKDIPFVVALLILYVFFTMLEIYHLVTNLRPDSKKNKNLDEAHKH